MIQEPIPYNLPLFRVNLVMRYTRISCQPYRARKDFDVVVQASDPADAVRQACLCIDRDLEEILWAINSMNVSEVHVAVEDVEPTTTPINGQQLWNAAPFSPELSVPRYIVVKNG